MKTNRYNFVKSSAAASAVATMAPTFASASDDRRVKLGFIGVGGRGTSLLKTSFGFPKWMCLRSVTSCPGTLPLPNGWSKKQEVRGPNLMVLASSHI